MPSTLAAYLAKNYLTASTPSHPDEPPKKKRKKSKHLAASTGLIIADDDEDLTLNGTSVGRLNDDENNENDVPALYEGKSRSAEFRKAKKSTWKTLPGDAFDEAGRDRSGARNGNNEEEVEDEADILLRTAQSVEERRLAQRAAEDLPTIVNDENDKDPPAIGSSMRAGLQTAADTARLIEEEEARSALLPKASKKSRKSNTTADDASTPLESQTIYRDATGRRIDISAARATARREAAAKVAAEKEEKLSSLGEVQRRELEARKQDLEDAKFLTLGRGVDDEEMNERLREVVRWDDPMAGYIAQQAEEGDGSVEGKEKRKGKTGKSGAAGGAGATKRVYQGSAEPNRYGIKPGWRWDGVDRGNGFEKEWFQARSRKGRNERLAYEWQMDE